MSARNTTRAAAIALAAATIAPAAAVLAAGDEAPDKIFVYNGSRDDGYDRYSRIWCYEQACLLGPNGEFPRVDGNNLKIDSDGDGTLDTTTGTVIRDDDNNIIGYESNDGTKRVYDIDTSATFERAWNEVDQNGEVVIAKHGSSFGIQGEENGGTGVFLDGGKLFLGFKEDDSDSNGTVAIELVGLEPYCLPPRKGAMIDIWVNSCYSNDDPDGDGDGRRSVTGTAGDVRGVDDVRGNTGCILKCVCFTIARPDGEEIPDEVFEALRACARANGFTRKVSPDSDETVGWWGAWLGSLNPENAEQAMRDCLSNNEPAIDPDGYVLRMDAKKGDECEGAGEAGSYAQFTPPVLPVFPEGGFLPLPPQPPISEFGANGFLPPLPEPIPFHMFPLPADIGVLPIPELLPPAPALLLEPYFPLDGPPLPPLPEPFVIEIIFPTFGFEPDSFQAFALDPRNQLWFPIPADIQLFKNVGLAVIDGHLQDNPGPFLVAGIPLPKPPNCLTDFDGNGVVNAADIGAFITQYFVDVADGTLLTDFDGNGVVNAADIGAFITQYFEDLANPLCTGG